MDDLSTEVRDGIVDMLIALERREWTSLAFLLAFSLSPAASLPSLCITSARAFPTEDRLRDCRMELLVTGLEGAMPLLAATCVDISAVYKGIPNTQWVCKCRVVCVVVRS